MTVKDLRTLVDNLEEYIHVPGGIDRLKKTILHLAVSGQLVPQDSSEGTGLELYDKIQAEKQKLIAEGKLKIQKPIPEITDDEIPFEIPESWKWVRLGDVLELVYGKGIEKEHRDKSFQYAFYGANGELDKVDKFLVEKDGIIVGRKGSAGAVNLVDGPFWPSDVTYFIEDGQFGAFDRKYLFYLLLSLNLSSFANGIKPGLNRNDAYALAVVLYPQATQVRIAKKLDKIYATIDELEKKCKAEQEERRKLVISSLSKLSRGESVFTLDMLTDIIKTKEDTAELRKTVLHLAVSGQLVPQDPSEGTGQMLYNQIQVEKQKLIREGKIKGQKPIPEITDEEVPFKIPEAWKWVRLGEVTNYGTNEKAKPGSVSSETWVLELEDIEKVSSRLIGKVYASKRNSSSDKNVFYTNDVLYGKLRPYLDKVIVADEDGVCTTEILPLRTPGNKINSRYLWLYLKSPTFVGKVNSLTYGVKMPRLGTKDGREMPLQLPPPDEQSRIVQKTTQLLRLLSKLEPLLER